MCVMTESGYRARRYPDSFGYYLYCEGNHTRTPLWVKVGRVPPADVRAAYKGVCFIRLKPRAQRERG